MAHSIRVTPDFRTRIICEARLNAGKGLFSISDSSEAQSADSVVLCLTPATGRTSRSTSELAHAANNNS